MKTFVTILFLCVISASYAQTDSTATVSDTLISDTSDIYVINKTNRFVAVDSDFAVVFRDLKSLKEIHSVHFSTTKEVEQFFATCFRVLEKDVNIVGPLYSISRNKLSKNVVRIEDQQGGYFFLSYDTVEKMQAAFYRTIKQ